MSAMEDLRVAVIEPPEFEVTHETNTDIDLVNRTFAGDLPKGDFVGSTLDVLTLAGDTIGSGAILAYEKVVFLGRTGLTFCSAKLGL